MDTRFAIGTPATTLLRFSLLAGPLFYLFVDSLYSARGWTDGWTANLHAIGAVIYGGTALALVLLTRGRWQAVLAVVALLGAAGNAGVADNTLHVSLGAKDLFDSTASTAQLVKFGGFFFPMTFLIAAVAIRVAVPVWSRVLLALGAVIFPMAHVGNISVLAIVDAVVMVVALGGIWLALRSEDEQGTALSADITASPGSPLPDAAPAHHAVG